MEGADDGYVDYFRRCLARHSAAPIPRADGSPSDEGCPRPARIDEGDGLRPSAVSGGDYFPTRIEECC